MSIEITTALAISIKTISSKATAIVGTELLDSPYRNNNEINPISTKNTAIENTLARSNSSNKFALTKKTNVGKDKTTNATQPIRVLCELHRPGTSM